MKADSAIISDLHYHVRARGNAVALRDWNFEMPRVNIAARVNEAEFAKAPIPPGLTQEHYRYPHLYQSGEAGRG